MNDISPAPATAAPARLELTGKRRPFWQTLPCPVWCSSDHDEATGADVRRHYSSWSAETRLSLESPDVHVYGGARYVDPVEVEVFLQQDYREVEPRVVMGEQSKRHYDMTPDEARQLAQALTTAADIAEGHANPVVTR